MRFNALAAASRPPAATGTGLAGELTRLAGLHAAGMLSDAEFQAAKAKLLAT